MKLKELLYFYFNNSYIIIYMLTQIVNDIVLIPYHQHVKNQIDSNLQIEPPDRWSYLCSWHQRLLFIQV